MKASLIKLAQVTALAMAVASFATLTSCEKNDGPAEEVGEAIDEAADDVKDATN